MNAAQQYLNSVDESRFKAMAQKLAQHLQNQSEDPHIRVRWIWELIQNAKDAPNKYGKVKIKILITEKSFTFMHNGDPLKITDLQSIVTQISSKSAKNNSEEGTTGKYGTGFITTYVVSRKLKLSGLIQEKPNNEEKQIIEKPAAIQLIQTQDPQNDQNCLKFSIILDRTYQDRDKDFPKKLAQSERQLINCLREGKFIPIKRDQNSMETIFQYIELDEAAHNIINQGLSSLFQLYLYVFLFNQKLNQIIIEDKRKKPLIYKFLKIQAGKVFIHKGISIMDFSQKKENQEPTIKHLSFIKIDKHKATIAVPICFNKTTISILNIDEEIPKVFKQFPLIGSPDTGYNYVFTSENFYPNETRQNLLLGEIQGRVSQKSRTNRQILNAILQKSKDFIKMLVLGVNHGLQHFLKFGRNDFLGSSCKHLRQQKDKYLEYIKTVNLIPYCDFSKKSISCLKLIYENNSQKDSGCELNQLFRQLYLPAHTINKQVFQNYIKNLRVHEIKNQYQQISIYQCLKQISHLKIDGLMNKLEGQEKALKFIQDTYKIVLAYKKEYLNYKWLTNDNNKNLKIVLNRELVLKTAQQQLNNKKISMYVLKKPIPEFFLNLSDFLSFNINTLIIKDSLRQYFTDFPQMKSEYIIQLAVSYFSLNSSQDTILEQNKLSQLYQIVRFTNQNPSVLNLARQLKVFSMLPQINLGKVKVKEWDPQNLFSKKLFQQIILIFNTQIEKLQAQNICTLLSFHKLMKTDNNSSPRKEVFEWLDLFFQLQKRKQVQDKQKYKYNKINRINYGLSWDQVFKNINQIYSLNKTKYPNEKDLKLHQNLRIKTNFLRAYNPEIPSLKSILAHPQIKHIYDKKKTFNDLFEFISRNFKDYDQDSKKQILEYIHDLKQEKPIDEKKLEVFGEITKRRLEYFITLSSMDESEKDALYELLNSKISFRQILQLIEENSIEDIKLLLKMNRHQQ